MTGFAWEPLTLVGTFLLVALGDLVSEEVRGWLDLAPHAVLRLAASQLDPAQRETVYQGEWVPELIYVLRGAESRPITRLIRGLTFALGLLVSARGIAAQHSLSTAKSPAGFRAAGVGPFKFYPHRKDELEEFIYWTRPAEWKRISRTEFRELMHDDTLQIRKLRWGATTWSWPQASANRS